MLALHARLFPSNPFMRKNSNVRLKIALVYETLDAYPRNPGDPADHAAEYEPESTISALEAAFEHLGHEIVRVGTPHALLDAIAGGRVADIDAALSIAEGFGSRNREGWALALLEMAGIPALGSDALTLSLCLDKAWTQRTVEAAGIRVAPHRVIADAAEARAVELPAPFPLFVKPRWEGTSKGIGEHSRVESRAELAHAVERIARDYKQPALVEAFLPGAEYTVTISGHDPPRAWPVLQRALDAHTRIGLHAVEGVHRELRHPTATSREHCLPGKLSVELEARLQRLALDVFALFECRDFARVDFRLDPSGQPVFLEINPLPTFAVDGSFGILAELEGRRVEALLADVFAQSLSRLGLSERGVGEESS